MNAIHYLDGFTVRYDLPTLSEQLKLTADLPEYEEFAKLLEQAAAAADPRAAFLPLPILERRHQSLSVPGAVFVSPLLARQCAGDTLYLFAASCGNRLDKLHRDGDDVLRDYWLDVLKFEALRQVSEELRHRLPAVDNLKAIEPTDEGIWPLSGLRDLFRAMPEPMRQFLAIELCDILFMVANKSRGGVYFEAADADFCPCHYCKLQNRCPNSPLQGAHV